MDSWNVSGNFIGNRKSHWVVIMHMCTCKSLSFCYVCFRENYCWSNYLDFISSRWATSECGISSGISIEWESWLSFVTSSIWYRLRWQDNSSSLRFSLILSFSGSPHVKITLSVDQLASISMCSHTRLIHSYVYMYTNVLEYMWKLQSFRVIKLFHIVILWFLFSVFLYISYYCFYSSSVGVFWFLFFLKK